MPLPGSWIISLYEAKATGYIQGQGIKTGVAVLILQAGWTMLGKMKNKLQPRITAACAFAAMLAINVFALRISSVVLMLLAGCVSLALFIAKGAPAGKGGAAK